jgi:hypothetical protein
VEDRRKRALLWLRWYQLWQGRGIGIARSNEQGGSGSLSLSLSPCSRRFGQLGGARSSSPSEASPYLSIRWFFCFELFWPFSIAFPTFLFVRLDIFFLSLVFFRRMSFSFCLASSSAWTNRPSPWLSIFVCAFTTLSCKRRCRKPLPLTLYSYCTRTRILYFCLPLSLSLIFH